MYMKNYDNENSDKKKKDYQTKQKIFSITLNLYFKKIKLDFSYN